MTSPLQQDFSRTVYKPKKRLRPSQFRLYMALFGVAILLLLCVLPFSPERLPIAMQTEWVMASVSPMPTLVKQKQAMLKSGDHAALVLKRLGFSNKEAHRIIKVAKPVYSLAKLRAGQTMTLEEDASGKHLYYPIDSQKVLHLNYGEDGWKAVIDKRVVSSRLMTASGEITGNLFTDAVRAGLDDRTTINLVDIFAWDIDFARDLRMEDRFKLLFEETFDRHGEPLRTTILAAEFINRTHTYQAIRYHLASGAYEYFSPKGKNLRKTYLKSPVKFTRISSRFSRKRKHPVLGYNRAHRGVDYAAASGTPIRAVGDGYIHYAGNKGGYGRFVEIRHNNRSHSSAYAHLRKYGRGVKKGKRVRQGQIIGYVGMSGLATGPHLHYEFRVRGRAVNPLTVKRVPASPIPKLERPNFLKTSKKTLTSMHKMTNLLTWE
ncbi:MAG: M23 family metallopeptidase [Mariprofundaceae bacterium]